MPSKSCKEAQESQAETVPYASSLNHSTPRSSAGDATGQKQKRTVEVDFFDLPDGTLVEMIEDPHDPTKSFFATWKDGQIEITPPCLYAGGLKITARSFVLHLKVDGVCP